MKKELLIVCLLAWPCLAGIKLSDPCDSNNVNTGIQSQITLSETSGNDDLSRKNKVIQELRDENAALKSKIEAKNETIKSLQAEIDKLKNRVKEVQKLYRDKINPQQKAGKEVKNPSVIYNGKPRSKEWLNQMYNNYADTIILLDGKFVDVGKAIVGATEIPRVSGIGTYGETPDGCKVLQVLKEDELIVVRPYSHVPSTYGKYGFSSVGYTNEELIFHVTGIDTTGIVDDSSFSKKLISVGSYEYTNTYNAKRTIASYAIHEPLTTDQFIEALNGGFKLVEYVRYPDRDPSGKTIYKVKEIPIE